ncbi:MAG: phosphoenolpyruvate--protein phosphotransferase, partial [Lachnospiraceae bacterium]|nr:phosphoenolpyruvate--protein phosphotransferase [Lachnospiraceae bacterium]
MERFLGKGVSPGIAIGKIHVVKKTEHEIRCIKCEDTLKECEKYEAARAKVQSEREELYEKTVNEAGEEAADIFQFHVAILDEDEDLTEGIMEMIREEGCNAEYAVETVFEQQADVFRNMDDAYYKARSADIVDVKNAVLAVLFGDNDNDGIKVPCILAAEDFAPSDTVKLDRKMLLGMVTRFGSSNSHTAILARSMNIPAIIGCDPFDESIDGKNAVIDSNENVLIIDPTDDVLKKYRDLIAKETEKEIKRRELIGKESITKDGRKVL